MRFFPALLLMLMAFIPHAVNAQDDDRTAVSKPKAAVEKSGTPDKAAQDKTDTQAATPEKAAEGTTESGDSSKSAKPAPKQEENNQKQAAAEEETAKTKVDWVNVESTGTLSSGKQGGLEKTVWAKQKRSEIEFLTARLPSTPALRSVHSLQRRLLLSRTDFGLIENDIGPLRGQDFLIQRIRKLIDMGLYDDAWELYTQKAENPYDISIAQQGMTLMVMRSDLATACLEEKVFAARYPKDAFFATLDKACSKTLGAATAPSFGDNKILQAVYHDPAYKVSATAVQTLEDMGSLERALVMANGKISYDGLTAGGIAKVPSSLLSLYLLDKTLPETARAMAEAEARNRGIAPYMASIVKDEEFRKIRELKNADDRWTYIESAFKNPARRNADYKPLIDYILAAEPKNLSTDTVIKTLNVLLANGQALTPFWVQAAEKIAPQKPLIYIYLQAFKSLTPTKITSLESGAVQKALVNLKQPDSDQIIAIIESLDKNSAYDRNTSIVYDKHLGLTLEGDYVMPSVGLTILLETASGQKQPGITVLAVLNSLAAKPDNMYSGSVRQALYSMLNVGLIEDAKMIGSEIVASVLNKY